MDPLKKVAVYRRKNFARLSSKSRTQWLEVRDRWKMKQDYFFVEARDDSLSFAVLEQHCLQPGSELGSGDS